MLAANRADGASVLHRDRLPAAGVVGDGQHDQRNAFAANARDQFSSAATSMLPFEGKPRRRLTGFGNRQIDGFGADEFDVGARGVEVRVVGNHVALLAHHAEQNAFGGASLVRRDHMLIAEDVLDGVAEVVEAAAAGVALVAQHDRCPLLR